MYSIPSRSFSLVLIYFPNYLLCLFMHLHFPLIFCILSCFPSFSPISFPHTYTPFFLTLSFPSHLYTSPLFHSYMYTFPFTFPLTLCWDSFPSLSLTHTQLFPSLFPHTCIPPLAFLRAYIRLPFCFLTCVHLPLSFPFSFCKRTFYFFSQTYIPFPFLYPPPSLSS